MVQRRAYAYDLPHWPRRRLSARRMAGCAPRSLDGDIASGGYRPGFLAQPHRIVQACWCVDGLGEHCRNAGENGAFSQCPEGIAPLGQDWFGCGVVPGDHLDTPRRSRTGRPVSLSPDLT